MRQENRELIVSIQRQIESLPVSRYYRGLQAEVGKLSLAALTDLKEILNEVEQMGRPIKRQKVAEPEPEEEIEDPCPECNGGEVYDGEFDIMCCGRCEGTGTLS